MVLGDLKESESTAEHGTHSNSKPQQLLNPPNPTAFRLDSLPIALGSLPRNPPASDHRASNALSRMFGDLRPPHNRALVPAAQSPLARILPLRPSVNPCTVYPLWPALARISFPAIAFFRHFGNFSTTPAFASLECGGPLSGFRRSRNSTPLCLSCCFCCHPACPEAASADRREPSRAWPRQAATKKGAGCRWGTCFLHLTC
jgi:hypothetical protein